mmetsp:Transcript_5490/g.12545  ORF Transcript_5490/g.12545 Transcript_5490/m.12545 type:complete len:995 (-) Transcript_5490:17-3001(-)
MQAQEAENLAARLEELIEGSVFDEEIVGVIEKRGDLHPEIGAAVVERLRQLFTRDSDDGQKKKGKSERGLGKEKGKQQYDTPCRLDSLSTSQMGTLISYMLVFINIFGPKGLAKWFNVLSPRLDKLLVARDKVIHSKLPALLHAWMKTSPSLAECLLLRHIRQPAEVTEECLSQYASSCPDHFFTLISKAIQDNRRQGDYPGRASTFSEMSTPIQAPNSGKGKDTTPYRHASLLKDVHSAPLSPGSDSDREGPKLGHGVDSFYVEGGRGMITVFGLLAVCSSSRKPYLFKAKDTGILELIADVLLEIFGAESLPHENSAVDGILKRLRKVMAAGMNGDEGAFQALSSSLSTVYAGVVVLNTMFPFWLQSVAVSLRKLMVVVETNIVLAKLLQLKVYRVKLSSARYPSMNDGEGSGEEEGAMGEGSDWGSGSVEERRNTLLLRTFEKDITRVTAMLCRYIFAYFPSNFSKFLSNQKAAGRHAHTLLLEKRRIMDKFEYDKMKKEEGEREEKARIGTSSMNAVEGMMQGGGEGSTGSRMSGGGGGGEEADNDYHHYKQRGDFTDYDLREYREDGLKSNEDLGEKETEIMVEFEIVREVTMLLGEVPFNDGLLVSPEKERQVEGWTSRKMLEQEELFVHSFQDVLDEAEALNAANLSNISTTPLPLLSDPPSSSAKTPMKKKLAVSITSPAVGTPVAASTIASPLPTLPTSPLSGTPRNAGLQVEVAMLKSALVFEKVVNKQLHEHLRKKRVEEADSLGWKDEVQCRIDEIAAYKAELQLLRRQVASETGARVENAAFFKKKLAVENQKMKVVTMKENTIKSSLASVKAEADVLVAENKALRATISKLEAEKLDMQVKLVELRHDVEREREAKAEEGMEGRNERLRRDTSDEMRESSFSQLQGKVNELEQMNEALTRDKAKLQAQLEKVQLQMNWNDKCALQHKNQVAKQKEIALKYEKLLQAKEEELVQLQQAHDEELKTIKVGMKGSRQILPPCE